MKSSELDWIPYIRTLETFRFLWSPLFESNNQKISFNLYIVSTFAKSCYLALSVLVMFLRRRIVFTQTSPFYISRNCCNENILSAHCILAEWDNGRASCCLRLILPFNLTAEHIIQSTRSLLILWGIKVHSYTINLLVAWNRGGKLGFLANENIKGNRENNKHLWKKKKRGKMYSKCSNYLKCAVISYLCQGPYRHYVLNAIWILINLLAIMLTIFHLR